MQRTKAALLASARAFALAGALAGCDPSEPRRGAPMPGPEAMLDGGPEGMGEDGAEVMPDGAVVVSEADAPTVDASPASDWETVRAQYGVLTTLAGRGASDRAGTVEWQPSFENGPASAAELSRPHLAMADAAGNVYIADKEAHAIRKVTPAGVITTLAGTNESGDDGDAPGPARSRRLASPNALHVLPDGTVYVLDLGNGKVRRVARDGTMTTIFSAPGGIAIGRGLHVEPDGATIYFASGQVVRRWTAASGAVETFSSGYEDLGMVAAEARPGSAWRLLVADRGGHRVYAVDAQGGRTIVAGSGAATGQPSEGQPAVEAPLVGVRAVWPHPAGGLLVGTHQGCQVWYVDRAGRVHLFLDGARGAHGGDGARFDSPGAKISEIRSLAVAPNGEVIVTESDTGFVRIVKRAAP